LDSKRPSPQKARATSNTLSTIGGPTLDDAGKVEVTAYFLKKDGSAGIMSKNSERVKLWRLRNPDRARDAQAITNARRGGYAAAFV
jgi:hypothetical protein